MLARISGVLEDIAGSTALVATDAGLAYEVLLPAHLAITLTPTIGEPITLHTHQFLEPQAQGASFIPRLIGFQTRREREFFLRLTRVKGLGAKRALRAMREPASRIASAITSKDARFLQTLPEIGKRLAETIIVELHGKVDEFCDASAPQSAVVTLPAAADQAIAALERLGQSRNDAERLVARAIEREPTLDSPDAILAAAFGE
jgi:holliday junction DNA helicase RuvA